MIFEEWFQSDEAMRVLIKGDAEMYARATWQASASEQKSRVRVLEEALRNIAGKLRLCILASSMKSQFKHVEDAHNLVYAALAPPAGTPRYFQIGIDEFKCEGCGKIFAPHIPHVCSGAGTSQEKP